MSVSVLCEGILHASEVARHCYLHDEGVVVVAVVVVVVVVVVVTLWVVMLSCVPVQSPEGTAHDKMDFKLQMPSSAFLCPLPCNQ